MRRRRKRGLAAHIRPHTDPWVYGDIKGLNPKLVRALAATGKELGQRIYVRSGFRSRKEQEALYAAYKAGRGPLAARPGTSRHESGNAADVQIGERSGPNLASVPKAAAIAKRHGLHFPVPGEPWHSEVR